MLDAQQRHDERVAARLRQDALAGIDHQNGDIGGRRTRRHVAGVLLVTRRVGDDELALFGREKAIGNVNRDALFALGGEAIDQQRKVDFLTLCADLFRVVLQRRKLIFKDHLGIVEQPPDQRGLAVIDGPAGDEAQQRLCLVRFEIGVDVGFDEI